MKQFLTSSLFLCAIQQSQAFHSLITSPFEIAKDMKQHPKAVVFFGGKSCRACNFVKPKFIAFANEPHNNSTAFYTVHVDGNELCLQFAQSCKIKTIPTVAIFKQEGTNAEPNIQSCSPQKFEEMKLIVNKL